MCRAVIFGGTTEGRLLHTYCIDHRIDAAVYVATEYGGRILGKEREARAEDAGKAPCAVSVHTGRLAQEEMAAALRAQRAALVIDATHPYAALATEHIKAACEAEHISYKRVVRDEEDMAGVLSFDGAGEVVGFLKEQKGNVFVTTGSTHLDQYTALPDFRERLYARVLPDPETIRACIALGIEGRHLAAMQGPFSEEMNYAFLMEYDIRWMVTKQSGRAGGFAQKRRAAQRAGADLLVIRRREMETGITVEEAMQLLEELK